MESNVQIESRGGHQDPDGVEAIKDKKSGLNDENSNNIHGTSEDSISPVKVVHGKWMGLPDPVRSWVREQVLLCQPRALHIMDGGVAEDEQLKKELVQNGCLIKLTDPKYHNCYLARTDPKDVARVECKTVISTPDKVETVPLVKEGTKGALGNWIHPADLDAKINELFPGCMQGRTMYLVPFSMGPVGGPLSKNGVELTDSAYVAVSMRIMTRVGTRVLECIRDDLESQQHFVKCLHSVGCPLGNDSKDVVWPCNPDKVMIAHKPHTDEIISFGSGYGGNSLLGKKCFALRIGSTIAKKEGWLAEHMLIMGIRKSSDQGCRQYITAAFPSACGKTNLAMLQPSLPGYDVTCVGDDIAWLRFNSEGELRAINPENGFFGVAPGTCYHSNPVAMKSVTKDTVFTNVALTDEGGVWWEGMTPALPEHLIDWHGRDWTPGCGREAAHPNSRFCAPATNCPILDENWEDPHGVKIEAILFGGRRPEGVPLVIESFNWDHGVLMGAGIRSETTAAAEYSGKVVMHDPFSMRPFFGYNFGHYLGHWLSLHRPDHLMPRVFTVNWFRKDSEGRFLWPGFGENIRVLDWALRRCRGEDCAVASPVGYLPAPGAIRLDGLEEMVDYDQLFSAPKDFWTAEVAELREYFTQQVGDSLPPAIWKQLEDLESRCQMTP